MKYFFSFNRSLDIFVFKITTLTKCENTTENSIFFRSGFQRFCYEELTSNWSKLCTFVVGLRAYRTVTDCQLYPLASTAFDFKFQIVEWTSHQVIPRSAVEPTHKIFINQCKLPIYTLINFKLWPVFEYTSENNTRKYFSAKLEFLLLERKFCNRVYQATGYIHISSMCHNP